MKKCLTPDQLSIFHVQHLKEDVLSDRHTYEQVNRVVSVLQFLASYLYGRYGDMSGIYPALFVTYLTSAITYGLLSVAYEDNVIFASRILTVFMHNIEGMCVS